MNKQQAIQEIKELKARAEELQKYIEQEDNKEGAYGFVNPDDSYYYLAGLIGGSDIGFVVLTGGSVTDTKIAFKDKQPAQAVADAIEVWQELCMCDGAYSEFRTGKNNFSICYDVRDKAFKNDCSNYHRHLLDVYFATYDERDAAIAKLGKEKLKKLFMVK